MPVSSKVPEQSIATPVLTVILGSRPEWNGDTVTAGLSQCDKLMDRIPRRLEA